MEGVPSLDGTPFPYCHVCPSPLHHGGEPPWDKQKKCPDWMARTFGLNGLLELFENDMATYWI